MNIFFMLTIAFVVACGAVVSKILKCYGPTWDILGFIAGLGLGILILVLLRRMTDVWCAWRPIRPLCKHGKCAAMDYQLIELREDGVFLCRCGTKYIRKGRRFLELREDGSCSPYMRRLWVLGKWQEDTDGASGKSET